MPAKPVPDGHHAAIPSLIVHDAVAALAFYRDAFGATETLRLAYPDGRIAHAEIAIGGAPVMLADEHPDLGFVSPRTLGGSPVGLTVYVEDVDASFARAIAAGATVRRDISDEFYGDRSGQFTDPFGHVWTLSTRIEDVANEEMIRRFNDSFAAQTD